MEWNVPTNVCQQDANPAVSIGSYPQIDGTPYLTVTGADAAQVRNVLIQLKECTQGKEATIDGNPVASRL